MEDYLQIMGPGIYLCASIYLIYLIYWTLSAYTTCRADVDTKSSGSAQSRDGMLIALGGSLFGILAMSTGWFVQKGDETLKTIAGCWLVAALVLSAWGMTKVRCAARSGEPKRLQILIVVIAGMPLLAGPAFVALKFASGW